MEKLLPITPEQVRPTLHEGREDSPELGTAGMQGLFDAHPNLNTAGINDVVARQNANNAEVERHIDSRDNPNAVTKAQVGLANADNTADADKPVSAAQAAALLLKSDKVNTYSKTDVDTIAAAKVNTDTVYARDDVDGKDAAVLSRANLYTDRQIKNALKTDIYNVPYFDPTDGNKRTLQDILERIFGARLGAYSWQELQGKITSWEQFESNGLSWHDINNGGW